MKQKRFSRILAVWAAIFIFSGLTAGQRIRARIEIGPGSTTADVRIRFLQPNAERNLGFLRSQAGTENLAARISELVLEDDAGLTIPYKKLIDGEFLADRPPAALSYRIDLGSLKKPSSLAHVSWIRDGQGVLMLDDVLPQLGKETRAELILDLPKDWKIVGEKRNPIDVPDIEKAVFLVGKGGREREVAAGKTVFDVAFSGEFLFSDDEAAGAATEILREYQKIFGGTPNVRPRIFLLRFPADVKTGNWEAETRGSNVVVLSSDMPFKSQSVQRLHEQLRHELFHLWLPNAVALTGSYDWFYEGFALYQSLKTGVALNRIRFEDFLDALGRAYDLDNMQTQKVSLVEASKNRWNGLNAQIYARGMLVAFLSDAALLGESRGRRSLTDVFRALYEKHQKPNAAMDANRALLDIFETSAELRPLGARYIKGAEKLAWQTELERFGIETNGENFPVKLVVRQKLNGRQKDLLNELGYNNWRKLSRQSK